VCECVPIRVILTSVSVNSRVPLVVKGDLDLGNQILLVEATSARRGIVTDGAISKFLKERGHELRRRVASHFVDSLLKILLDSQALIAKVQLSKGMDPSEEVAAVQDRLVPSNFLVLGDLGVVHDAR